MGRIAEIKENEGTSCALLKDEFETSSEQTKLKLNNLFLKAHGQLQLHEDKLNKQLMTATKSNVSELANMVRVLDENMENAKNALAALASVNENNLSTLYLMPLINTTSKFCNSIPTFKSEQDLSNLNDSERQWLGIKLKFSPSVFSDFVSFNPMNVKDLLHLEETDALANISLESSSLESHYNEKQNSFQDHFQEEKSLDNFESVTPFRRPVSDCKGQCSNCESSNANKSGVVSQENKDEVLQILSKMPSHEHVSSENLAGSIQPSEVPPKITFKDSGNFVSSQPIVAKCVPMPRTSNVLMKNLLLLKNSETKTDLSSTTPEQEDSETSLPFDSMQMDTDNMEVKSLVNSSLLSAKWIKPASVSPMHLEENVIVSATGKGFTSFYIQRKVDEEEIQKLNARISKSVGKLLHPQRISNGVTYLAPFSEDRVWYRAIVLTYEQDACEVLFVDYGNREQIPACKLKICPRALDTNTIPPFAFPCSLWNFEYVDQTTWHQKGLPLFTDLVRQSDQLQLFIYSVDHNLGNPAGQRPRCRVDLRFLFDLKGVSEDLPISARDYFLFLELGRSCDPTEEGISPASVVGTIWERSFTKPNVPLNAPPIAVSVTCVHSPSNFFVRKEIPSDALDALSSDLQIHCSSQSVTMDTRWKIHVPKIGLVCVAKRNSTDFWHRARIEALKPGSTVKVTLVDTGEQEEVYLEQLRKIPDIFFHHPAQAIHCKLNIKPLAENGEWGEDAIFNFKEILKRNATSLSAIFHKRDHDVYESSLVIAVEEKKIDMARSLVDANYATASNDSVSRSLPHFLQSSENHFQPTSTRMVNLGKHSRKNQSQILCSFPDEEVKPQVEVSSCLKSVCHIVDFLDITSPSLIHVRLVSMQQKFNDLQNVLYEEIKSAAEDYPENFQPTVGEICIAKLSDRSSCFARVKLLQRIHSSWKVHLVDCGGIKDLSEDCLKPIPQSLRDLQNHALIVSIADISAPCGKSSWPTSTIDNLRNIMNSNTDFYMVKKGQTYKDYNAWNLKVLPVDLGWIQEVHGGPFEANQKIYISCREHLLNNGLALPLRASSNNLPSICQTSSSVSDISLENSLLKLKFDNEQKSDSYTLSKDETSALLSSRENSTVTVKDEVQSTNCLPRQPPLPPKFQATVTNIDIKGNVCLHLFESRQNLAFMSRAHNYKFKNSETSNSDLCWNIGDYVVANYHLDGCWYRAQILCVEESGEVKVEFIDYGNKELVSIADIRTTNLFPHIPVQCYKCSLGIIPVNTNKWAEEFLDFLHGIVVTKDYNVTVLENKGRKPKIMLKNMDKDEMDVADFLVNKMKVCKYENPVSEESDIEEETTSDDVVVELDGDKAGNSIPEVPDLTLPSDFRELIVIKVVSIVDPSICYLNPQKELVDPIVVSNSYKEIEKAIDRLNELQVFIATHSETYKLDEIPHIGGLYMDCWEEARKIFLRVTPISLKENEVKVYYMDFGTEETISVNRLYKIPKQFQDIPALAIKVQLQGVCPPDNNGWSERCMKEMIDCLINTDEKIYASFVTGSDRKVNLFFKDRNGKKTLCYKKLFEDKLINLK